MKALSYLGPSEMVLIEKDVPTPQAGEVLIRVKACGICGSDVHGFLGLTGRRIPPVTMGHEFAGEIAALGADASKFKVGDRVAVQPINFCGECSSCKKGMTNLCRNKLFFGVLEENGALAEYVAVPEKLLYPIPDSCSYAMAALAEPLAVAYGSLSKCGDLAGKHVAIVGAGAIGLCALALVKLQNPKSITVSDLSEKRLAMALKMGATHTVNPMQEDFLEKISANTDGEMIDVSIEAVGVQATANQSIQCLCLGGKTVWLGMSAKEITVNMQEIVCPARSVLGSFNYSHVEFGEVVELIGSGKLDISHLITEEVPIEKAIDMFVQLHERADDFLKVIVCF